MKPFVLLAHRRVDLAADDEYAAMLRFGGLEEGQLRRVRMEQGPIGPLDLEAISGIILGGGPFNASDPVDTKSQVQVRVERELHDLLDEVVGRDLPFLGCCYGIGALGLHQGAVIDRQFSEPVGSAKVSLTDAGAADPLFAGLPTTFEVFLGHKEAVSALPPHAVSLATSDACPVQAYRVGRNVYATQFHPELDVSGIQTRIDVYRHAGYFDPAEAETLKSAAATADVVHPGTIVRNFVEQHAR